MTVLLSPFSFQQRPQRTDTFLLSSWYSVYVSRLLRKIDVRFLILLTHISLSLGFRFHIVLTQVPDLLSFLALQVSKWNLRLNHELHEKSSLEYDQHISFFHDRCNELSRFWRGCLGSSTAWAHYNMDSLSIPTTWNPFRNHSLVWLVRIRLARRDRPFMVLS